MSTTIAGYETHPAAEVFPMLSEAELNDLAADIRAHGLIEPIVLHGGQILDGRNRATACQRAGVALRIVQWSGQHGSPVEFVIARNLKRRHLNESQRAMAAAALVPAFEGEAKERERDQAGKFAHADNESKGRAREKAARLLNVGDRLVGDAVRVAREASPEVLEAIKRGEMRVAAARRMLPRRMVPPPVSRRYPVKRLPSDLEVAITLLLPLSALAKTKRDLEALGFKKTRGLRMKLRAQNA